MIQTQHAVHSFHRHPYRAKNSVMFRSLQGHRVPCPLFDTFNIRVILSLPTIAYGN